MTSVTEPKENMDICQKDIGMPAAGESLWHPTYAWYLPGKFVVEFLVALGMLLLSVPVIFLAALLVKLTSSGPAFYSQTRVGRFGRLFTIYKLRSMTYNCESLTGARWSTPGDPRVTFIGRLLRWTHIDELPQLWNVLRGEMSLIGPRPERPEFIPKLESVIPHYRDRLLVRPGLTGLAQVQLPPDTDLTSVRRKLSYDLYYTRYVSPWLDLRVFVCTPLFILGLPLAWAVRLYLVPHSELVRDTYESAASESTTPQLQAALAHS